ncbi:PREDICTED: uncharacterized protein LOC108364048, partial [Rhagoletis zephyria]
MHFITKSHADMGSQEFIFLFITTILSLAQVIAANLESRCPFALYQEYNTSPGTYVTSSAATAFAELEERNLMRFNKNNGVSRLVNSFVPGSNGIIFSSEKSEKFQCTSPPSNCGSDSTNFYYRTFDGTCNNFQNPDYGMAKS